MPNDQWKQNKGCLGPEPYVANYPALREWLTSIGAVCNFQHMRKRYDSTENWSANGRTFVIIVHANGNGWEIYTACDSNKIADTLRDAERRLGLLHPAKDT